MPRFLALGDSYTVGEGVGAEERWPARLLDLLRDRGLDVTAEIVARTAWTTDELHDAIAASNPRGPFDLVTLMIGVNDQYRGRSIEEFCAGFEPLFVTAVELAGGRADRTVLVSIPDWGCTPFAAGRDGAAIARDIDAFNAWLRARAEAAGAAWVDVTPISRCMSDDPALVAADGLHPGGEIHRRWANAVAPAAIRILSEGTAIDQPRAR